MLRVFYLGGILGKETNKIRVVAPLIRTNKTIGFGHYVPELPSRQVQVSGPS